MRNLLFISLALLITSCNSLHLKKLRVEDTANHRTRLMHHDFRFLSFKSTLQYKNKQFSGIFVVKKMSDLTLKMTMIPKIGPKLFDFEFDTNKEFIVHYCIKQMDRPIVLRIIENDLRLLFGIQKPVKKEIWHSDPANNQEILKVKTNKSANYYFVDNKTGNLVAAKKVSTWGREKVVIEYAPYEDRFPTKMGIKHLHLPLSLDFKLLQKW